VAADAPRMDWRTQVDFAESLADLEVLVFGRTNEDDNLVQKFLAADEGFTAHLVARLACEPVVLH
jgi:hypothetical protein